MSDKKKLSNEEIKNEELTDEQANKVTGGGSNTLEFKCEKCYKTYLVKDCFMVRGKKICRECYYRGNTFEPNIDYPVPELPGPPQPEMPGPLQPEIPVPPQT